MKADSINHDNVVNLFVFANPKSGTRAAEKFLQDNPYLQIVQLEEREVTVYLADLTQ